MNTDIWTWLMGLVALPMTLLSSCLATGCVIDLRGGGEAGLRVRHDSSAGIYHTVDGDKSEATSQAKADFQALVDYIVKMTDDDEVGPPAPTE